LTVDGKEPQWVTKEDMKDVLQSLEGDHKLKKDEVEALLAGAVNDPYRKCKIRLKWFLEENSEAKKTSEPDPEIKVDEMLASDVKGAGPRATQTFNLLKRLSVSDLMKMSGNRAKEVPWREQSIYKEFVDKYGNRCFGMVKRKTGKKNGVIRMIVPGENIEEAMFKNSQKHGMERNIPDNGEYAIRHWKEGKLHGIETYYKEDGTIICQTEYKNGKRATLADQIATKNDSITKRSRLRV